ncbi:MAG: hypothetical protein U5N58_10260 [Actinomycetota bacterium]|nr:hypothetical protein [Actinomycetota bacterium]
MKLLDYSQDKLTVNMVCSSGTYVRWAAHHLGKKLGCGAMLSGLVRTRIGNSI